MTDLRVRSAILAIVPGVMAGADTVAEIPYLARPDRVFILPATLDAALD